MKIPAIKKAIEKYSIDELRAAEEALLNEIIPTIEIDGADEGEQLTHTIAAIEIKVNMQANNTDFIFELRAYTLRVRNSIN